MLVACSSDESSKPPADQDVEGNEPGPRDDDDAPMDGDDDAADDDDAGQADNDAPDDEPDAGPPRAADAGRTRDGGASRCGDGIFDGEREECDPAGELLVLCQDFGFSGGELGCTEDCRLELSGCLGDEQCVDGRDNDGDMLVDCDDDDCEAVCADACAGAVELQQISAQGELVRVEGNTLGHAQTLEASCAAQSGASEVVYRYVPRFNGLLEVVVESGALLVASVRTECDATETELACGLIGTVVQASVRRDEPVYVVVDGREAADQGSFTLSLAERRPSCGDGIREPDEPCDDGNQNDADGCTSACVLNPTEVEPNDTTDDANAFSNPFFAEIAPSTDVDVVRFEVPEDAGVSLRVIDLDDGGCAANTMDPLLRVFDQDGELVAEDDDGGDGFCAELAGLPLAPGSYTAEISRVSEGTDTFPYRLVINQAPVAQ